MTKAKLAEYHKFDYQDLTYLYKVNDMKGYRINKALSDAIDDLAGQPELDLDALPGDLRAALDRLGLFEDPNAEWTDEDVQKILPERQAVNSISLNVAQLCNLSCIYCYGVDGEYGEKGYMKHQTAFDTVDWLFENSLDSPHVCIIFFGGEPLLNFPLIKEVVKYANEKGAEVGKEVHYSMTTNGTMFRKDVNEFLNENDFTITISFDGDPEMQDTNRPFKGGRGSYKVARKKVAEFLETRQGRAMGRATITGNNSDLAKVRESLVDIGFNQVATTQVTLPTNSVFPNEEKKSDCSDKPAGGCGSAMKPQKDLPETQTFAVKLLDMPNGKSDGGNVKTAKILDQKDAQIDDHQHQRMLEDVQARAIDFLDRIKKRLKIHEVSMMDLIGRLHSRKAKIHYCGAGRNYLGVSISGDIYPCHRFVGQKDRKMGNIRDWDMKAQQPFIQNYGMSHEKCSKCFARYFCGGGCFHDSIEINGHIDQPNDEYCQKMHRELEMGIVVYDNLNIFDKVYLGLVKTKKKNQPQAILPETMVDTPEELIITD